MTDEMKNNIKQEMVELTKKYPDMVERYYEALVDGDIDTVCEITRTVIMELSVEAMAYSSVFMGDVADKLNDLCDEDDELNDKMDKILDRMDEIEDERD